MKTLIFKMALILSVIFLPGCVDTGEEDTEGTTNTSLNHNTGNNTGGTTNTTGNNKVEGSIKDHSTALAIQGAIVSVGARETTTDSSGSYTLDGVPTGERVVVTVKKDGYATTSKIVSLSGSETESLDINMLAVGQSQDFNPTNNTIIEVPNSTARVEVSANTLVLENGNLPSGTIHADVTPINPALDINLMPGDMLTRNSNNQLVPIESYGALIVDFKDSSGNKLNLSTGSRATIRIPVTTRGANTPNSIPLYYFDENQGVWVKEGTATLVGNYYEGTVTHFSTWNADYLFENITIHGCVSDTEGNRKSGAKVQLEGVNYNGSTSTYSNSNGEFSISAKKDAVSVLVASTAYQVSNSKKVGENGETRSDVTLEECLLFGAVNTDGLTVRLSWGENPEDLDTHVIGPDNYHIAYWAQGSLASEPYAQLDVDDTDSYGPEVFTALSFPTAGTYHYAVYHYSGSSTISASPARVELTFNGRLSTYVPPAGQEDGQLWWNVFDIVVNSSGNITIVPVNTWSSTAPLDGSNMYQKMFVMPPKI